MKFRHAILKLLGLRSESSNESAAPQEWNPRPPQARRYSKEELGRKGLLLRATVIPIGEAPEKGIFVGVYSRGEFEGVEEFKRFTANISSITQDWYSYGDLESAYEYYFPPDSERVLDWQSRAQRSEGSLIEILEGFGYHYRGLPGLQGLVGALWWGGDRSDFWVVGEGEGIYFEAYLADLT